ncbi:MAG TPA: response regulator transcription factor, partial [Nitrolancea sp.]|nr:response regulator transcription factor [Nitrolancea sp.]
MIKLFLVDDQPSALRGLRQRLSLEPDIRVIGEACNGEDAVQLVPTLCPDIVLMDVAMPGMDGITATTELRHVCPQSAVVILSLYDDSATRERAQSAGAVAFVAKDRVEELLLWTVRQAVCDFRP